MWVCVCRTGVCVCRTGVGVCVQDRCGGVCRTGVGGCAGQVWVCVCRRGAQTGVGVCVQDRCGCVCVQDTCWDRCTDRCVGVWDRRTNRRGCVCAGQVWVCAGQVCVCVCVCTGEVHRQAWVCVCRTGVGLCRTGVCVGGPGTGAQTALVHANSTAQTERSTQTAPDAAPPRLGEKQGRGRCQRGESRDTWCSGPPRTRFSGVRPLEQSPCLNSSGGGGRSARPQERGRGRADREARSQIKIPSDMCRSFWNEHSCLPASGLHLTEGPAWCRGQSRVQAVEGEAVPFPREGRGSVAFPRDLAAAGSGPAARSTWAAARGPPRTFMTSRRLLFPPDRPRRLRPLSLQLTAQTAPALPAADRSDCARSPCS
ncbi:uncharacterized protein LOC129402087 isoform X1 [Sorex araneus]|uniref:uncharacterized protein LOC129402087 isoform X1 n=1 Tax=Sorex araneus TaxID=42254 RepID=UPI002433EFA5|nr:uncharacterized protein LOC129402087 isoform X1 [Sorex araneus]